MKKSGKAAYISESDLQLTLKSLKGKNSVRNQAVLLASHFMGLRAKEMASLKMGDVYDFRNHILRDTIRLLAAYTKGNKYREVFLLDTAARNIMLEYILSREDSGPEAPLFLSQKLQPFTANTMQRMIGNLYKKAGINGTSHSGRRSFATRLIRHNVDIYSIQQLMGHSSITTTQEYFASDPNLLKEKVFKLSQ
ncbi:site-specific integrase [Acinetobacter lwoffii]|uniref:tyrosine-type recombinase/integrase n=1 Tax=Acinetobacter lwoffii TaxID=28090 RepID=UPI00209A7649|nr:site-specific integrase [Acinetobacter lwoffii]MCO8114943.1 site-specific integrase [Acinetobacter lwoffii]